MAQPPTDHAAVRLSLALGPDLASAQTVERRRERWIDAGGPIEPPHALRSGICWVGRLDQLLENGTVGLLCPIGETATVEDLVEQVKSSDSVVLNGTRTSLPSILTCD